MMATPVSIALIWQMMFHPQLGVLNYLLSLVGIGPQPWIFSRTSALPSLALVETWQWTPFVMLIVLGGLAALPTEPYEAARIDGASRWQVIRYVTSPLVWPYIMVAIILRAIDALKTFDIIYVMTQEGRAPRRRRSTSSCTSRPSPSSTSASPRRWWSVLPDPHGHERGPDDHPAEDVMAVTARRLGSRLAFAGFLFSHGAHAVLLLLDDLAVAQDGRRQPGEPAGPHSAQPDAEELRLRVPEQPASALRREQHRGGSRLDRPGAAPGVPAATASPGPAATAWRSSSWWRGSRRRSATSFPGSSCSSNSGCRTPTTR
jgi:hypothetical protein